MTAVLIKLVETDLIIPYEKNAKKHPATQVEQIAKSISNFGFNVPILVDKANVIVTGHTRYLVAQKLNLKQVRNTDPLLWLEAPTEVIIQTISKKIEIRQTLQIRPGKDFIVNPLTVQKG